MSAAWIALAAVVLDWRWGEPRRFHPLVGFGRLAEAVERRFYGGAKVSAVGRRLRGVSAVAVLLAPLTAAAAAAAALPGVGDLLAVLLLYLAIGQRSLHDHARNVVAALREGDDGEARRRAGLMVSRDPEALDVRRATIESVLENGNDAVFAALFWFALAGPAGAVCYRLANTLDAMWGYRNSRYRHFGWAAARFDDLMNLPPARLTALTFALLGKGRQALVCWRRQAPLWESPNAGLVMAAGAGALGITLGGPARYGGAWHERPQLGSGVEPVTEDIERALRLVRWGAWLWLGFLFLMEFLYD